VTSKTTRREDRTKKRKLYRDVLKVPEYFQFDPTEDYLHPPLQGFRLIDGEYQPIEPLSGRLPSAVLGLHFERDGTTLRLHDPATGRRLLTPSERAAVAETRAATAETRAVVTETENERLRREVEELRRRLANGG
jgi:hypothetical protein